MLGWVTRCLPGFSIIGLVLLLVFAFSDILNSALWRGFFPPSPSNPSKDSWWSGLNPAQIAFVAYAIVIHTHMVGFTLRLAWSIFRATHEMKRALERRLWEPKLASSRSDGEEYADQPMSPISMSSSDTFEANTGKGMANGTMDAAEGEIIHAIILPNYCEDHHTLETTLKVLASHPRAKSQYEVRRQ